MPDISMCMNTSCPLSPTCYRKQATPNQYRQSYAPFEPEPDGTCKHYWPDDEHTTGENDD